MIYEHTYDTIIIYCDTIIVYSIQIYTNTMNLYRIQAYFIYKYYIFLYITSK